MVAAQGGEIAVERRVRGILGALADIAGGGGAVAEAGLRIGIAVEIHQLGVAVVVEVVEPDPTGPAVVEDMFERAEDLGRARGPLGPVGAGGGAVGPVDERAGAVDGGQTGPGRARGVGVLVARAEAQGGVGPEIGLHDAVEDRALLLPDILGAAGRLPRRDEAAPEPAVEGERAGDVDLAAHIVLGAGGGGGAGLEVAGRALADEVDRGARLARADHEAGGAAHELHMVVHRHVHHGIAILIGGIDRCGDAVEHVVGDLEAAREEQGPLAVVFLHRDAGGVFHHVGHVGQVLVLHEPEGDRGGRLRRILLRQHQPGGRPHPVGCPGTGALGGGARRGRHVDRVEHEHRAAGRLLRRRRHGGRRRAGRVVLHHVLSLERGREPHCRSHHQCGAYTPPAAHIPCVPCRHSNPRFSSETCRWLAKGWRGPETISGGRGRPVSGADPQRSLPLRHGSVLRCRPERGTKPPVGTCRRDGAIEAFFYVYPCIPDFHLLPQSSREASPTHHSGCEGAAHDQDQSR